MNRLLVKKNSIWGKILAGIGVLTVLSEVGIHIYAHLRGNDYDLNHIVVVVGALIGFAGFWSIDDKKTKAAAEVITDLVPKFGRRKTDAVAIPEAKTEITAVPTGEQGERG